jgi:hypothetical protein
MNMGTIPKTGRSTGGGIAPSSILAIIAGALMVAGVIVGALMLTVWNDGGGMMTSPGMMGGGGMLDGGGMMSDSFTWGAVGGVAAIWVGTGTVNIVGGNAIYRNPQGSTKWGIAILIASIVGLLTISGFIIGPILGIVAGILALVKK